MELNIEILRLNGSPCPIKIKKTKTNELAK